MAYLLPLKINKRRYFQCKLEPQAKPSTQERIPLEFVIVKRGSKVNLCTIDLGYKVLQFMGAYKEDISLRGNYAFEYLEENGQAVLKLYINDRSKVYKRRSSEGKVVWFDKDGKLIIETTPGFFSNDSLRLDIVVNRRLRDREDEVYTSSLLFHICEQDATATVALDFGSESSQVAYRYGKASSKIISIDILEKLFRSEYYGFGQTQNYDEAKKDFWQFEEATRDFPLLKSIFFMKRGRLDPDELCLQAPSSKEKEVILAAPKSGRQSQQLVEDYFIIPNLKFSEFASFNFKEKVEFIDKKRLAANGESIFGSAPLDNHPFNPDDKINLRRIILNKLLIVILDTVKKRMQTKSEHAFIKLILLVPNTYRQDTIHELIYQLQKDLSKIIHKDGRLGGYVDGIEISTISESDASFCGFAEHATPNIDKYPGFYKSNQYYLIIDAGKGTLDFSILKSSDRGNNYTGVFRAGIPGSGQVISFAILEHILTKLNKSRKAFFDYLGNYCGWSDKLEIFKAIDHLKIDNKIKFPENFETPPETLGKVSENERRDLQDEILRICYADEGITDTYGIITKAIDGLVENLYHKIDRIDRNENGHRPSTSFHRIILTGRALLYKPFQDKLKASLHNFLAEDVSADQGFVIDESLMKIICLKGALSEYFFVNFKSEVTGNLQVLYNYQDTEEESKQPSRRKRKIPKNLLEDKFFEVNEPLFLGKYELSIPKHFNVANLHLYVGGTKYIFKAGNTPEEDKRKYKLSISQDGYVLRKYDGEDVYKLETPSNDMNLNGTMLKSIFPFSGIDNLLEIHPYVYDASLEVKQYASQAPSKPLIPSPIQEEEVAQKKESVLSEFRRIVQNGRPKDLEPEKPLEQLSPELQEIFAAEAAQAEVIPEKFSIMDIEGENPPNSFVEVPSLPTSVPEKKPTSLFKKFKQKKKNT